MTKHIELPTVFPYKIRPGKKVRLSDYESRPDPGLWKKRLAYDRIAANAIEMAQLARKLYAENKRSILLVLQGMDTAGKDGTIRAVMRGMNPRSCQVVSFKKPNDSELEHDFLWRVHKVVPPRGSIGIFNRSHYEDVLIVRVHNLVPQSVWTRRYDHINDFERMLADNGTTIIKCCLHVSKETQRERLQARIDDPASHWKFNMADLDERKKWDAYVEAYEAALEKCNTDYAPWHIVPADRKWYRNLSVSELVLREMKKLDPQFPVVDTDPTGIKVE